MCILKVLLLAGYLVSIVSGQADRYYNNQNAVTVI